MATGSPGAKRPSDMVLWFDTMKPWLPLIGTVFGLATIYLLSQVEALRPTLGLLGGVVVIVGGVIYGVMRPEDAPVRVGRNRAQALVIAASLLILAGALYPFYRSNFPGTPHFQGTLSPRHPKAEFRIESGARLLDVVAHGSLRGTGGTAEGGYELKLAHEGKSRRLTGEFKRTYSVRKIRRGRARVGSTSEFTYDVKHTPSFGTGEYQIELVGVDAALKDHLRVLVYTTHYDQRMLFIGLGALVLLGFVTDVASTRARHRTRLAQAAVISGGFSLYFALRNAPDAVMTTTIGGGLVALLAGAVLGFVFGKLAKTLGHEPKAARAAGDEDND